MPLNVAKMAHLSLSACNIGQLREQANELRGMATTARLDADIHALETLAARFDELAASRGSAEQAACYPPCPQVPAGEDFAEAWQIACRHLGKRYLLPETLHHPGVMRECYDFACMILAYGLVPKMVSPIKVQEAQAPAVSNGQHRAIVVDDVPDVLVSVGAFLVNAEFTVRKAPNGEEALRVITSDPLIDVLVADFAMPGLNGADLITQAMQIRPSLRADSDHVAVYPA